MITTKEKKPAAVPQILNRYHEFDIEKIIQALAYIQRKSGETDKINLIKYLFFSDRTHVRRYFSFISKDDYFAMKSGSVAFKSLYILNKDGKLFDCPKSELDGHFSKITKKGNSCRIIDEENTDLLSKNEMKTMDFIIDTFKETPLVDISHEYPEWKKYEEQFNNQLASKEPITLEDFFTNPDLDSSPLIKKYLGEDPLYETDEYLTEAKRFCTEEMVL
jgi:hypothetical protein